MKVVIHILVSLIHVAFTLNTPTFTLLDSRSDAPIPIPNIFVTFPDGYSDNLVLNRFYSENEADGCHFLGHLENEQEACVAMTGCIGSEDVEFTIMSEHAPETSLFKWKIDGDVEVIEHPFKNGADNVITRADDVADDTVGDPAQMKAEYKTEQSITAKSVTPPPNQKLQVKVFYDKAIRTRLGGHKAVKSYYDSAHVHLQASYCHSSLGSKIKIERVGDVSFFKVKEQISASPKGTLAVSDFTLNNIGNADLIIYLTDNDNTGFAGYAPIATVCVPSFYTWRMNLGWELGIVPKKVDAWKSSINEYQTTAASFGKLMAHELGHNLGMNHDFHSSHGGTGAPKSNGYPNGKCETNENIMSYDSSRGKWSTCSKKDFQAHYLRLQDSWCMEVLSSDACFGVPKPKPTLPPCNFSKNFIGDKYCDDGANNAACKYDGGDCCGSNVKKNYCKQCKCLDPKGQ